MQPYTDFSFPNTLTKRGDTDAPHRSHSQFVRCSAVLRPSIGCTGPPSYFVMNTKAGVTAALPAVRPPQWVATGLLTKPSGTRLDGEMDPDRGGALGRADDQRGVCIGALLAAQGLDVSTTLYGLRSPEIAELNPVAAAAMARLGEVPGLLCLAFVAIVAVVVVTETAARRYGPAVLGPDRVRWLGYAPHVALSVAAALNNVLVATAV